MDDQKIPILVIEHCLCYGCKNKFKKLKEDIPQVHSIEFNTEQGKATIFGAVDPATVMVELARKGITPKILWEKNSPINNHNHAAPSLPQPVQSVPSLRPPPPLRQGQSNPSLLPPPSLRPPPSIRQRQSDLSLLPPPSVRPRYSVPSLPPPPSLRPRYSVPSLPPPPSLRPRQYVPSLLPPPSLRPRQPFPSLRQHQNVPSLPRQVTQAESTGVGIQNESIESIVKETPDCYLNHKHELVEVKGFNKRFSCDGCKEDGFKSRYRCEGCNFDLHYECRFPKLTISPEIHEELVFEFRPQPPTEKLCDACGKEIHGCFYNCKAKGMDLHPCCARLKAQVRNHDSDNMIMDLRKKVSSECLWCREKKPPGNDRTIPGWCYVSNDRRIPANIHIHCITQLLHVAWQRGLMDGSAESSIETIDFQRMPVSEGNRRGRGTELAFKIIGILRIIVGILLGDPSVFFGKLMFEFLEQLLSN